MIHLVPIEIEKQRIVDYAIGIFPHLITKKSIKKAIKRGEIFMDGAKAQTGWWVRPGQEIKWVDSESRPRKVYFLDLKIIFEDDHLAIINKPGGIPVSGNQFRTIEHALHHNLKPSKEPDTLPYFRPVHRLDAPTCGLLLIAKTVKAQLNLRHQFANRSIQKRYQAIVIGRIESTGEINLPIEEKEAITKFQVATTVRSLRNKWLSLVNLHPVTGRTHQLRIHLLESGHPILGDKTYAIEGQIMKGKGLFLCAVELGFQHPASKNWCTFQIRPPQKFERLLERENRNWMRKQVP